VRQILQTPRVAGLEPVYDIEFTSHLAKDSRVLEVCVCERVCMYGYVCVCVCLCVLCVCV